MAKKTANLAQLIRKEVNAALKKARLDPARERQHVKTSQGGAPVYLRRWIIDNPQITAQELEAKLRKAGKHAKFSTIVATRYNALALLRDLEARGWPRLSLD